MFTSYFLNEWHNGLQTQFIFLNNEVGLCGSCWVLVAKKLDQMALLVLVTSAPNPVCPEKCSWRSPCFAPTGEAYMRLNKLSEAEHWYRESLRAKPDHIPAHLTYGKLLSMTVRLWSQPHPKEKNYIQAYSTLVF